MSGDWSMKTRIALAGVALMTRCVLALAQTHTVVPGDAPPETEVAQTTTVPADFTVGDIKIEGLQRVSEGTVDRKSVV